MRAGESPASSAAATSVGPAAVASAAATSAPAIPVRGTLVVAPALILLPPGAAILGLLTATDYADDLDGQMIIMGVVGNGTHLDGSNTAVTAIFYRNDGHKRVRRPIKSCAGCSTPAPVHPLSSPSNSQQRRQPTATEPLGGTAGAQLATHRWES